MGVVMQMMVIPHHQQIARLPVVIVIYVVIIVHAVLVEMVLCLHVPHGICGQTEISVLRKYIQDFPGNRSTLLSSPVFPDNLRF
jgi:hypothetical protein